MPGDYSGKFVTGGVDAAVFLPSPPPPAYFRAKYMTFRTVKPLNVEVHTTDKYNSLVVVARSLTV